MKNRLAYSYAVLRYVHDTVTGEFVNVGLAMFSAEGNYLRFSVKATVGRVTSMFPSVNASSFKDLLRVLKRRFSVIEAEVQDRLALSEKKSTLDQLLLDAMPFDDSSLVWSPVSSGVSSDLSATFDMVFARYITKFDQRSSRKNRTDEDVWRQFRRDLEKRNLLNFFESKNISGKDDELEFPFAWKNGIWHCVEPISFDLAASDSIRDKAHKWLGQIASVTDSAEKFKVYLVLAKPSQPTLEGAFEKAVAILRKAPVANEVFVDGEMVDLVEMLHKQVGAHKEVGQ